MILVDRPWFKHEVRSEQQQVIGDMCSRSLLAASATGLFTSRKVKLLRACYVRGMTLREFLVERAGDSRGPAEDRLRIREYSDAVKNLIKRFRDFLTPYKTLGLELEDWMPLLKERWIPYNAPALTVRFRDDEIVVEPKGTFVVDGQGRVSMTCGMREVHLDWLGDDNWTFRWVLPRTTKAQPLSDQDIEDIVLGLLS